MNQSINSEFKFIAKPMAILSILVVLFITVFAVGIQKVNDLRSRISSNTNLISSLNNKVSVLERIPEILSGDITFLDIALPSRGAVLYGLSQVKNQAIINEVVVTNLKTGSNTPESGGVSKTSIVFDVEGQADKVYNFLSTFSKALPLMNVDRARITKSGDLVSATVTIYVYTADLPEKIQSVTASTKELTTEELEAISEISVYSLPLFKEPKVFESEARIDPFSL
jgi:hypothetical protein